MAHEQPSRPLEPNLPLSSAKGTAADEARSARLLAYLDAVSPLETEAQRGHREKLLHELSNLLREWIRELAVSKAIYPDYESAAEAGGRLYIAGSYRLGINNPDGDVDTVAVVPVFVTREDFFSDAAGTSSKRARGGSEAGGEGGVKVHPGWVHKLRLFPEVEHLNMIRGAGAEIIELKVGGMDVDMGFGRVLQPTLNPATFNILDDAVLRDVTRQDMISLNGPRVTELVHKLVTNFEAFKVLVRAVRLWAKLRGLYSNKMGYLGGVNFNIMCALICQLYPNLPPAALLGMFFATFSTWKWPNPVFITRPYITASAAGSAGGAGAGAVGWDDEVFDPATPRNRNAFMPVITPAYPCSNSLYNVSGTTLGIMDHEFKRAVMTCAEVLSVDPTAGESSAETSSYALLSASSVAPGMEGEQPAEQHHSPTVTEVAWDRLFAPSEFFLQYDSYLVLDITAENDVELSKWKGFVESRVRMLVMELERSGLLGPNLPLQLVHPYPKTYERREQIPAEEIAAARQKEREAAAAAAAGGSEEAAVAAAAAADVGQSSETAATAMATPTPHPAPPAVPTLGVRAGMKRLAAEISGPHPDRDPAPLEAARLSKSANYDYGDDEGLLSTTGGPTSLAAASGPTTAATASAAASSTASVAEDEGEQALLPADFDAGVEGAVEGDGEGDTPAPGSVPAPLPHSATPVTVRVKEEGSQAASSGAGDGLPGVAELQPLPPAPAPPAAAAPGSTPAGQTDPPTLPQAQADTATSESEPPQYRTVFSIFLGLQPDKERVKKQALSLSHVLRAFTQDKLYAWADRKESMVVKPRVLKWAQLPPEVHPDGREIAELSRQGVKARMAAEKAAYAAQEEKHKALAREKNKYIRPQSGGLGPAASAAASAPPAEAAATEGGPSAPLRPEERKFVADKSGGSLFPSPTGGPTGGAAAGGGGIPGLSIVAGSRQSGSTSGVAGAVPGLGGAGDKRGREEDASAAARDAPAAKRASVAPLPPVVSAPRPIVAALPVGPARPLVAAAPRPTGAGPVHHSGHAPAGSVQVPGQAKVKFKVQLLGK